MPIKVQDKTYPLAGQGDEPSVTGAEIIAIEDHFGVDGLVLIASLADDKPRRGYSQTKAMYALAWVGMTRGGETVSIDDVLQIPLDQIEFSIDDENPTAAA